MKYFDPGRVMEELDMDEQQLLLTCLMMTLGTEKVYDLTVQTVKMLRENSRAEVANMFEAVARKMIDQND